MTPAQEIESLQRSIKTDKQRVEDLLMQLEVEDGESADKIRRWLAVSMKRVEIAEAQIAALRTA